MFSAITNEYLRSGLPTPSIVEFDLVRGQRCSGRRIWFSMSVESLIAPLSPAKSLSGWKVIIDASAYTGEINSEIPNSFHSVGGLPSVSKIARIVSELNCASVTCLVPAGFQPQYKELLSAQGIEQSSEFINNLIPSHMPDEQVMVIRGDMPLITKDTILKLAGQHQLMSSALTLLTVFGQSRESQIEISRRNGIINSLVTPNHSIGSRGLKEIASGVFAVRSDILSGLNLETNNQIRITEFIYNLAESCERSQIRIDAYQVTEAGETDTIDNREILATLEHRLRVRIRQEHMANGVTLRDPNSIYIDDDVLIGSDTIIHPNVTIRSGSRIGSFCSIESNTIIEDCRIDDSVTILSSVLTGAKIEANCSIGPFSHLRTDCYLGRGVSIGTNVEIKRSKIGENSKIGHFAYLGDVTIGVDVNIGAGTVIANYDGAIKHQSSIGDRAFIGSNSVLISPVSVGRDAATAAGAIVTRDVEEGTLVMGVPARKK
jgi:bifunctional UDP-N-acetylglucosamine pyrophosphorylase/glucosamine-1-phosphate N-acetyltransferase